jgi:hypothetical protein
VFFRSRGSHSAEINSNASSSNTPATHTSMSSRENEVTQQCRGGYSYLTFYDAHYVLLCAFWGASKCSNALCFFSVTLSMSLSLSHFFLCGISLQSCCYCCKQLQSCFFGLEALLLDIHWYKWFSVSVGVYGWVRGSVFVSIPIQSSSLCIKQIMLATYQFNH